MATAKLYCAFVLLLYLQESSAQQGFNNNQNGGLNNAIGFQQQAPQRPNTPNNINQIPNGGLNINLPQQSNLQQGNLQPPISGNLQGNMQSSLSLTNNLQSQGGTGPLPNMQFTKPGFMQSFPGLVTNPPISQAQFNNGAKQNALIAQQQNMGQMSNCPMPQTQNVPSTSNSLAELAALKGHPSLLSLFASQNNAQPQQYQQLIMPNINPTQNQLTDVQKQSLVRAFQSQSSGQNQPGLNFVQTPIRVTSGDNQPAVTFQGQPISSQQFQPISTSVNNNQPAYVTMQAQPINTYMQNQLPQVEQEPSILSILLSELQPPDSQFTYPPYPIQSKGKTNLKTLIPLIINLLKEKNDCRNCGCPNNGCNNNNVPEPTIFSGYSIQKNYGERIEETSPKTNDVEEEKSKSSKKSKKTEKKNTVNVDSEEVSEENDSEYIDDSEDD